MSSAGPTKNKARADPTKAQARKVLRTMCNFMLPLLQRAGGQNMNAKKVRFGIEADEFVTELERFVSGMVSRSQPRSQDIVIETTMANDWLDYWEEANWLWIIPAPDTATIGGGLNNGGNLESDRELWPWASQIPSSIDFNEVGEKLQDLRRYITQKMPIRLLCFEYHDSKLRISLLDKADIYNYLVPKVWADFQAYKGHYGYHYTIENRTKYAILSHTWNQTPGEMTYSDWQKGSLNNKQPKCQKLVNFCKAAKDYHGLTFGWIDTVCINKESSAELDESIRSMYTWYSNAEVCITYLSGTEQLSDIHKDPWFTRGWTLQEMIAPVHIKFYNMHWNQLGDWPLYTDKEDPSILREIELATTMTRGEIEDVRHISISRRMQLAAERQVTRQEDIAYCLMGIFDVSISTAYGEGAERAFFRLVDEIFRSTKDVSDIFNCAGDEPANRHPITTLFPFRPSDYLNRSSNKDLLPWRPINPLTLTHLGLRTPVLLMPAVPIYASVSAIHQPIGDYHATVSIVPCHPYLGKIPDNYNLLDKRFSRSGGLYHRRRIELEMIITLTFGTLNVEEQGSSICIPKTCLAVLLRDMESSSSGYKKIYTEKPIVFPLRKIGNHFNDDGRNHYYNIKRSELAKHGMRLSTLIL